MKNSNETPFDVKVLSYVSAFLFILFGCFVITSFVALYILTSPINLKKIIIRGDFIHHSASFFGINIIPNIKGNFFTINLSTTRLALESLPWIRNATVKRVFPNQIEIYLQEHKPVAIWGSRDDFKMINVDGVIFDSGMEDDESDKLPQFTGPEGQSNLMLSMYLKLNTILTPLKVKLTKIELSSRGSWTAMLEGGAQLELGRGSSDVILERMKQFAGTLSMVTTNFNKNITALQYADLRHVNGYALKINGITTLGHSVTNPAAK
ncbi:MAG: FtsQ-type POTRA domain-containing protein [Glaciimonas sp.]|nr:FtsQ-type POTRA domain-containing protein [Glaciimonas sp.]